MKVAIYQPDARASDEDERLLRLAAHLGNANGTDLVLCPELFTSGYADADLVIARPHAAGGTMFDAVASLANTHNTAIAYG